MSPPTRVLVLSDRRYPTDHSFLEGVLALRLPPRGFRLLWVMQSAAPAQGIRVRRWHGTPVVVLPRRSGGGFLHLLHDRTSLLLRMLLLLPRLRRWRPQVVFVRNEPVYQLAAWGGRLAGGRSVFQLSHFKDDELLQRAADDRGRAAWGVRLQGGVARRIRRWLTGRSRRVLAISPAMAEVLMAEGVDRGVLETFPLGIDPAAGEDDGIRAAPVGEAPYLIQVGTLTAVRRPIVIVEGFRRLTAEWPDLHLVFLGGGHSRRDEEALVARVAALGLAERVHFHPPVPRREVGRFLRGARFALSLVAPDGILRTISPTKLMESLVAGVPVLASRGIPEQEGILAASGGGMLVEFTAEGIAEGMRRMLAAPDLEAMGLRGRAWILAHRNYEREADRLAAVLHEVAAR